MRLADLDETTIALDGVRAVVLTETERNKYDLEPNDLLFIRVNGSRTRVGSCFVVPSLNEHYAFCDHLICGKSVTSISSQFIAAVMGVNFIRETIDVGIVCAAGQNTISQGVLKSIISPIPPLAEQHRIVNALDKYLALVDAIERDRTDLDNLFAQLKSKVLDLAVRGELTQRDPGDEPACELLARIHVEKLAMVERGELKSKDVKGDTVIFTGSDGLRYEKPADGKGEPRCIEDEIPFELPEGWAWARFSNIVRKIGSKDNQVKTKGLLKNGDYPVISQSASSYVDGYYSGTIQPITSVPVLLFGDHTRTVKYINQPFVIGADGTKCHNAIGINPVFLFHAMQVAAERIENRGYGRHYALLERYLLAIPPLAEQRRINSAIEAIISATNL